MLLLAIIVVAQTSRDSEEFAFVRHQIATSRTISPKNGFVPDASTAVAVAYAVAIPAYGKPQIDSEKPLRAQLRDGKWIVLGTLHGARESGTLVVQIEQMTGRITYLNHSM